MRGAFDMKTKNVLKLFHIYRFTVMNGRMRECTR